MIRLIAMITFAAEQRENSNADNFIANYFCFLCAVNEDLFIKQWKIRFFLDLTEHKIIDHEFRFHALDDLHDIIFYQNSTGT